MVKDIQRIPGEWHIEYAYSIGKNAQVFFDGLADGKIIGARCEGCERVFVPPKSFCEYCFAPVDSLLEVGLRGRIEASTVVTVPFKGSPPVPYCVAYVRLEKATSSIANFVKNAGIGEDGRPTPSIAIGANVKVVFSNNRTGRITDFWFEPDTD